MGKTRKDSIKALREYLVKRKDALKAALSGDLTQLQALQRSGDMVDAALDTANDEISSQIAEVESRELTSISTALDRMKEGSYGQCEGCDGKIPLARLQALPYAATCINCQREAEKAGYSDGNTVDWSRISDQASGDDFSVSDFDVV